MRAHVATAAKPVVLPSLAPAAAPDTLRPVHTRTRVYTGSSDLKIQNAIVCIVPHSMVILKIYLPDTSQRSFMIYFLPVLAGDDD